MHNFQQDHCLEPLSYQNHSIRSIQSKHQGEEAHLEQGLSVFGYIHRTAGLQQGQELRTPWPSHSALPQPRERNDNRKAVLRSHKTPNQERFPEPWCNPEWWRMLGNLILPQIPTSTKVEGRWRLAPTVRTQTPTSQTDGEMDLDHGSL